MCIIFFITIYYTICCRIIVKNGGVGKNFDALEKLATCSKSSTMIWLAPRAGGYGRGGYISNRPSSFATTHAPRYTIQLLPSTKLITG